MKPRDSAFTESFLVVSKGPNQVPTLGSIAVTKPAVSATAQDRGNETGRRTGDIICGVRNSDEMSLAHTLLRMSGGRARRQARAAPITGPVCCGGGFTPVRPAPTGLNSTRRDCCAPTPVLSPTETQTYSSRTLTKVPRDSMYDSLCLSPLQKWLGIYIYKE